MKNEEYKSLSLSERSRGFTLLEVLVATAIMGIAVAALVSGLSGSLRNLSRLEDREKAVLLARSQLNRLLAEETLKPGPARRGRWEGSFRWEAQVRRWNPAGAQNPLAVPPLAIVSLTVYWVGATGEKRVTLETSKYEPALLSAELGVRNAE